MNIFLDELCLSCPFNLIGVDFPKLLMLKHPADLFIWIGVVPEVGITEIRKVHIPALIKFRKLEKLGIERVFTC